MKESGARRTTATASVDFDDRDGGRAAGFNLICINADELRRVRAIPSARSFFRERPSIGVWAWETDHVPERWASAFALLDEIWVYSSYVAENLGTRRADPGAPRAAARVAARARRRSSSTSACPRGFRFLFMFDFFSTTSAQEPRRPGRGVPRARSRPARGRSW